jgi:mono/diheme cytochrome c family protein
MQSDRKALQANRTQNGATMIKAAVCAATLVVATQAFAQTAVERGRYLVEGILTCGNCHSPRGPGGVFDAARLYSGGPQTFDTPAFRVKGSNITPDPETGIGKWSADDTKRLLQTGTRPDGVQVAPIMPYAFYKVFTPRDLDAVVAYLRSLPPVRNEVEKPVYKAAFHSEPFPDAERAMAEADLRDPVKRGFYLVTIGHCMECHSPLAGDRHDFAKAGAGGQEFKGPWGVTISRNITSHKEKGIGAWSDDEIKRAITRGMRRDGTPLKPPMAFASYATMTDEDLNAVVAYLRTVPARE